MISEAQAGQYASQAGFSGNALNIIVAIARAESGLNEIAQGRNNDGSIDRGVLQINSRWHAEVSDACAYNPVCAFKEGYRISNRGTNFSPWSVYNSGAYLRYLNTQLGTVPWYQRPQSRGYSSNPPHYGIDIPLPLDTPFFFLESGKVVKAGYEEWGGEIFIDPGSPGGPQEYVAHLDNIFVRVGQIISAGQVVGSSGGQLSGGDHPVRNPKWSTGKHVHWGIFTGYKDDQYYGPDPEPLLESAKEGNIIGEAGYFPLGMSTKEENAPIPIANKVNAILSEFPGFAGIALAIDKANQFPGIIWYDPGTSIKESIPDWLRQIPGGESIWNAKSIVTFDAQNYVGSAMRSVLDTIVSNTTPLIIRATIANIGLLLVIALIWRAVSASGLPGMAANIGTKVASRGMV